MVRFFLQPLSVRQMRLLCASLLAGFVLCGALQGLYWGRTQLDAGAALCADTLRLHIRAASDAVADQSAKLRVRDAVLSVMQQCPAQSAPEARAWAAGRLLQFQLAAQRALVAQGIRAPVRVYLVNMYFPARRYPSGQLPAGRYDAVRITIGSGSGQNWWCVLYPSLCFTNATCAVVDEDGKKELKEALSAEEYEMVTAASEFKIKWFFFGNSDKNTEEEHTKESD